jgi:hypothetical protein
MGEASAQQPNHDGRADFDFLMGRWNVHHRCLRARLKGSTSWDEFDGTSVTRMILAGLGTMDEVTLNRASGPVEALALRFYDPRSAQWSIYWADSVNGFAPPPVIGGFTDGRGEFYSQEPFEGKSVFCRFIWSDITATSCRWQQAFSADGGKTWETNWIMEFTRQQE